MRTAKLAGDGLRHAGRQPGRAPASQPARSADHVSVRGERGHRDQLSLQPGDANGARAAGTFSGSDWALTWMRGCRPVSRPRTVPAMSPLTWLAL